jgi:hypothetical protein
VTVTDLHWIASELISSSSMLSIVLTWLLLLLALEGAGGAATATAAAAGAALAPADMSTKSPRSYRTGQTLCKASHEQGGIYWAYHEGWWQA